MLLHADSSEFKAVLVLLVHAILRSAVYLLTESSTSLVAICVEIVLVFGLCRRYARGEPLALPPVGDDDIAYRTKDCPKVYAVVTGASSGVGVAVAKALVQRGMSVIIVGRNGKRLEEAGRRILAGCHDDTIEVATAVCNLTNRSDIIEFCAKVRNLPIALLVNNAGELIPRRQLVSRKGQGIVEHMMATNVFAPILMSELLLSNLRKTSAARGGIPSRIVNVASCAHSVCWGDVLEQSKSIHQPTRWNYNWVNFVYYYGLSKLCVIWYSAAMWKRFQVDGTFYGKAAHDDKGRVAIACCHPGIIGTRLYRRLLPEWLLTLLFIPSLLIGKTCEEGAHAVLRACIDDTVVDETRDSVPYMLCTGDHGADSARPLLSNAAANPNDAHRFCVWAFATIGLKNK